MTPGYWKVVPNERSTTIIQAICSAIVSPEDLDDLHVTLAYDKNNPDNDIPLSNADFKATISGVELFGANSDILVLTLDSEDLQREHARIHENPNVNFDFIPYRPHITIAKNATEAELECLHNIIMSPNIPVLSIVLGDESREDIDESRD
ncbi:RNA ligase [Dickeya phage vB_DsoM_JA29]|uniref:Anti-CBASS protein Acb1 n=1 Tax=Dickeya phage vB_DsoM_JA29 TaxID=2283031 RepID=A0A384ZXI9_9CAUD|nr:RNA ligase [Dickeya phage vB_DsoM_JA29]AXG66946.1 putative cyclic phosphodiesterase [Dickeya phage vB_DsoM_JA29]